MHECFWKTAQNRHGAGLPTYAFRRVVRIGNPKRKYSVLLCLTMDVGNLNNNQKIFKITVKSDYCHEIYHIYYCFGNSV
jgi:hypothetical protein